MAHTPERIPPTPRRRAPTLPQPRTPEWSAALAPSQRRAAERRSQLQERRSAQSLLRGRPR
jgi:hypothetical protein